MKSKFTLFGFLSLVTVGLVSCGPKPHSHSYDFSNIKWNWNEIDGGFTADATLTCLDCLEDVEGHTLNLQATVSSQTNNPTCELDGSITYNAAVIHEGQTYTDKKTIPIDKLGHDYKSISISGNYETTYNALDQFDTKNLVVTATCGREGCGKTKTLSTDEYFVIYQTSGSDHLSAGDTTVVISAGFARTNITNLTVNKIDNLIIGMEDHYQTTCGIAPDFSGVNSTAGTVQLKYFTDESCTDEVSLDNLSVGNYYVQATSGDQNYKEIKQTATLTVVHDFDECVQDDEYLLTPASKFNEATYYKSCLCGESSNSKELTFSGEGTKLLETIAQSAVSEYEEIAMDAPEGFNTVTKGSKTYTNDDQGRTFIVDFDLHQIEGPATFKFMTKNRSLCNNLWDVVLEKEVWYTAKITRNGGTYDSTISDESGNTLITYSNMGSAAETLKYYNSDGDAEPMEFYSTEVVGVRCSDETFGTFAAPSSVSSYVTVDMISPKGYQTVTRGTKTYNDADQGNYFLTEISMTKFESLSFAFFTTNRKFCHYPTWGSDLLIDTWYICTVEHNDDGKLDVSVSTLSGETKLTYSDVSSFKEALIYCNWNGDKPNLEWYSTEVRGVSKPYTSPYPEVLAESAINGATLCSESIPDEFERANVVSVSGDRVIDSKQYVNVNVDEYETLAFAIKCDGYLLLDGWAQYTFDFSWVIVEIVPQGNFTYEVTYKDVLGNVIYTNSFVWAEQIDGYTVGGLCSVMFRANVYASAATDSFYVTELRCVPKNN